MPQCCEIIPFSHFYDREYRTTQKLKFNVHFSDMRIMQGEDEQADEQPMVVYICMHSGRARAHQSKQWCIARVAAVLRALSSKSARDIYIYIYQIGCQNLPFLPAEFLLNQSVAIWLGGEFHAAASLIASQQLKLLPVFRLGSAVVVLALLDLVRLTRLLFYTNFSRFFIIYY